MTILHVYKLVANEFTYLYVVAHCQHDARWIAYDAHSCRLLYTKQQQAIWLDECVVCEDIGTTVVAATRGIIDEYAVGVFLQ